jgi:plasmid stabilization system protein ParE
MRSPRTSRSTTGRPQLRYVRKVFDSVDRLKEFPKSGKRPAELPDTPYREVVVPPCRVFYRVAGERSEPHPKGDTVFVLYVMRSERLLHSYLLDLRSTRAGDGPEGES